MTDQITSKIEKNSLTNKMVLAIAVEFGFIIVLPLVIFASLGKWLSNKYGSKLFLVGALIFSLLISSIWFYKQIDKIYKRFIK